MSDGGLPGAAGVPEPGGKPLRILLIHAQHAIQRHGVGHYKKYLRYAPLTMPTLAAMVPSDVPATVRVLDEMVETVDLNAEADLVGLTGITSASTRVYELAAHFRARGAKVVMGGVHATLMTEEALQHVDAVVRGHAEESWPQLLRDVRDGKLQRVYDTLSPATLMVSPDRRLLKRSEYVASNTVEMSRGCNKRCDFCVAHRFNPTYQTREMGRVMDEIRALPGKLVTFLDPNLIGDVRHAREFFRELAKLKRYWVGCVSIDVVRHPELLEEMVRSGAKGFLIGFESLDQEALNGANKAFSHPEDYLDAIRLFHKLGVMVQGSFVFGFDTDTREVFDRTVDFVLRAQIDLPQFTLLTPFPGTALYSRVDGEGRILTRDWSRYNGHIAVFQPKHMSPAELEEGVRGVWRRVYSYGGIARRLFGPPWILKPAALFSNLNFRRFMRKVHFGL